MVITTVLKYVTSDDIKKKKKQLHGFKKCVIDCYCIYNGSILSIQAADSLKSISTRVTKRL